MFLLFAYLFLALFVSFLCSIMESVLLSTPQSYIIVKQQEGHSWAKSFIDLKDNIDKPLSAILSLNTIAHTIGAAGVGAQAVKVFGEVYFGLVSAILTILILIVTEIIPKTIGARYNRNLAGFTVKTIRIAMFITYPLVLLSAVITRWLSKNHEEVLTSREEIAAMTKVGEQEGILTPQEQKILHNVLLLKNVKVTDVMTPRVVLAMADENITLKEFLENKNYLRFSRIPVFAEKGENITGYVFRQTVMENLAEDQHEMQLKDIKRPIIIVPNTMFLFNLWEKLLEEREHIALIVDQYGGVDGIVTMEDILETLLGLEIIDENDTITDMQKYARERWKERQAKYNLLDKLNSKS
ncbi:MAG: hemolysin [Draconibacterium sp.]|nr:MAG: hemolysin [Draconibacterium sp.]